MTLVVLAAGMGSRYGGLKQLDPITEHGEFIIDFSVYDALRAGFKKVVFIIKEENYDAFRSTIGKRIEKAIDVEYVFQKLDIGGGRGIPDRRVKPWGTGHALLTCHGIVKEDFAVINADDYYGRTPYQAVFEYMSKAAKHKIKEHYCMAGYVLGNTLTENGTVSRGVCNISADGYLKSITEHKKIERCEKDACSLGDDESCTRLDLGTTVSMNFYGFTPSILDYLKEGFERFLANPKTDLIKGEYFLPSAVTEALGKGVCDVKVLNTNAKWYGVTYAKDKPFVVEQMQRFISLGKYPDGLWENSRTEG